MRRARWRSHPNMIAQLVLAGLMLASPPLMGRQPTPEQEVMDAVDDFFAALRSDDKTALARMMTDEDGGVIYIHDRTDPANPRLVVVPVADHLARWESGTGQAEEYMYITNLTVDGTMAHVWGPYKFWAEGEISHCGTNSLSMVRTEDGWRVGNTSFTMVPASECDEIGAPDGPIEAAPW